MLPFSVCAEGTGRTHGAWESRVGCAAGVTFRRGLSLSLWRVAGSGVWTVLYVSNKAGLTGQTIPGRRIPGDWPYLGPDELAETEPVCPDGETFLSFTPPPP